MNQTFIERLILSRNDPSLENTLGGFTVLLLLEVGLEAEVPYVGVDADPELDAGEAVVPSKLEDLDM